MVCEYTSTDEEMGTDCLNIPGHIPNWVSSLETNIQRIAYADDIHTWDKNDL